MKPREQQPRAGTRSWAGIGAWWLLTVATSIALRAAVAVIPGNHLHSPWGGGGDAPSYVLLATFAMNARLRLPIMDPLIAALAAGGWIEAMARWSTWKGSRSPAAIFEV